MNPNDPNRQEIERLEQELAARRAHVSQLIGALEKKVSAGQLMGHGTDLAKQFGQTAKNNPLPSLMTAAGLAWLYARKDHVPGEHDGASLGSGLSGQHAGEGKLHALKDKAAGARQAISSRAHGGVDSYRHLLDENPMAAGAIAIAAGAVLGALLPPTRKEDELLGDTRDRLAERARELSAKAAEQARNAERSGGRFDGSGMQASGASGMEGAGMQGSGYQGSAMQGSGIQGSDMQGSGMGGAGGMGRAGDSGSMPGSMGAASSDPWQESPYAGRPQAAPGTREQPPGSTSH